MPFDIGPKGNSDQLALFLIDRYFRSIAEFWLVLISIGDRYRVNLGCLDISEQGLDYKRFKLTEGVSQCWEDIMCLRSSKVLNTSWEYVWRSAAYFLDNRSYGLSDWLSTWKNKQDSITLTVVFVYQIKNFWDHPQLLKLIFSDQKGMSAWSLCFCCSTPARAEPSVCM